MCPTATNHRICNVCYQVCYIELVLASDQETWTPPCLQLIGVSHIRITCPSGLRMPHDSPPRTGKHYFGEGYLVYLPCLTCRELMNRESPVRISFFFLLSVHCSYYKTLSGKQNGNLVLKILILEYTHTLLMPHFFHLLNFPMHLCIDCRFCPALNSFITMYFLNKECFHFRVSPAKQETKQS